MGKVLLSLFFCLMFLGMSATPVSAKILTAKNGGVDVVKGEVINDDLFVGAQTVNIEGTVNGDVFIGAQTVIITGIVNGNLHIGANTVYLNGTVKGNVYAGAQSVLVNNANLLGSLLVGAATVNIDKSSAIGGSVLTGAGSLSLDCPVKRNVFAGVGSMNLGPDANIGKDLYYASGDNPGEVNISTDSKVGGTVHKSEVKTPSPDTQIAKKQVAAFFGTVKLVTLIISFISALIIGFIYFKLFPDQLEKTSRIISDSFWKSLGIGFLITVSLVPGLLILLLTVIGIPIAGLVLLLVLLYSYMSKIVAGAAFGKWISGKIDRRTSVYGYLALGLAAIYILRLIPYAGFISGLVVLWTGLGAYTIRLFDKK